MAPPNLLGLPNELLCGILKYFIETSSIPVAAGTKRRRVMPTFPSTTICLIDSLDALRPNVMGLLLTCRFLHDLVMAELTRGFLPYEWRLDIAVIDDHWIFPTWRYIPPRALVVPGSWNTAVINVLACFSKHERAKTSTWETSPQAPTPLRPGRGRMELQDYVDEVSHYGAFHAKSIHASRFDYDSWEANVYWGFDHVPVPDEKIPCRAIDGLAHLDLDPLYPINSDTCDRMVEGGFITNIVGPFGKFCIHSKRG